MDVSSYLKLSEVALRLGISEKTARRYVKSGALPSIFVGNAYRVHPEALGAFVERTSVGHSVVEEPESPKAPAPSQSGPPKGEMPEGEQSVLLALLGSWRQELERLRDRLADRLGMLPEEPNEVELEIGAARIEELVTEFYDGVQPALRVHGVDMIQYPYVLALHDGKEPPDELLSAEVVKLRGAQREIQQTLAPMGSAWVNLNREVKEGVANLEQGLEALREEYKARELIKR